MINNINTPWQGHSHAEVEAFLKSELQRFSDAKEKIFRDLGINMAQSTILLVPGESGRYVKCATRAATANGAFTISAPFDVEACSELLIKTGFNPSDNTHASLDISIVAIFEENERTRTVQKKNGNNEPLYYVVEYDEDDNPIVTDQETTTDTGYPVYTTETYTERTYLPNNEDRFVAIADSGYYIANVPVNCKCVVSYKPGVTDTNVYVVKNGALANLTSQLLTIYERLAIAEAIINIEARTGALEDGKFLLGTATAGTLDVEKLTSGHYPLILHGDGAPSSSVRPKNIPDDLPWDGIPPSKDHIYINDQAASGGLYYAVGVNAVSDWRNA